MRGSHQRRGEVPASCSREENPMPLPDPAPNHPVERTAHSAGSVSILALSCRAAAQSPLGFDSLRLRT